MTQRSLRDQISKKLVRITGIYVFFTASILLCVVLAVGYFQKSYSLSHNQSVIKTRIEADIGNILREVDSLSRSPVLWTGLTDSYGRDAYLKPLIDGINQSAGYQIDILDYRGRDFISSKRGLIDTETYEKFVQNNKNDKTPNVKLLERQGKPGVIAFFVPVVSPINEGVAGFVFALYDPELSLEQLKMPADMQIDISNADNPDYRPKTKSFFFTSSDTLTITSKLVTFSLRISVSEPYLNLLLRGLGLIFLIVIAGVITIKRIRDRVENFAVTMLSRLDDLVLTCKQILDGNNTVPPDDALDDEITAVSRLIRKIMLEQRESVDQLRTSGRVFQTAGESILITQADGTIVDVNPALLQMTGYERADLIGHQAGMLYLDSTKQAISEEIKNTLGLHGIWRGETVFLGRRGQPIPVSLTVSRVVDQDGVDQGQVAIFSDISALKDAEKNLRILAFQDALTSLPNYRMFSEWIQQRIKQYEKDANPFILLFMDMDRLKVINDTHGHDKGDLLIRHLASHLAENLPQQKFLCRRSGDEFIAVIDLEKGQSIEDYKLLIADQLNKISISIEDESIDGSLSAGGVIYPFQAQTLNDLLVCADSALQQAKLTGRAKTVWYSDELGRQILRSRQVEERLIKAVAQGMIEPKYQPEVDMRTGEIIGFEALARWTDPSLGVVGPTEFIKIAEDNQLIEQLSEVILKKIIADIPIISGRFPQAKVAFNASPLLFRNRRLINLLHAYRATHSQELLHLEIEVTESDLSISPDEVFTQLREIQNMGINVSIDDFGKGYSSFTRLAEMPINRLKIDAGFVSGLNEPNREKIIRAIINLAHVLELEVTAEGVESKSQMKGLLDAGCYRAQGWLYSRELSLASLMKTEAYIIV